MKTKYILLLLASAMVGLSLGYLGLSLPKLGYSFKGSLIEPPIPAKEFSLIDQHGQTFTLSEQRGKVVLLFFGYTNCPDICPATLGKYKQIAMLLGDQADQVRFVMITTDPERDTAEQLETYFGGFNPAFIGLRGSSDELRTVYDSYWVHVEKEKEEKEEEEGDHDSVDYLVAHTSHIFVVNPNGNLHLTFSADMEAETIAQDLGYLIKTSGN